MLTVPGLVIPKEYEQGIIVIKSLSDSDVNRILEVLKDASPSSEPADIATMLRPNLPEISDTDIQQFAETLHSLYLFRSHSDVSADQFAVDLAEATRESGNPKVHTTNPEELAALERKLKSLLKVRPLSILAKALGLQYDFANIFWDAKVLSDIRPVWDGDVTKPPEGIVITQTLKLEYHYVGGHGEIYVCLDNEDIEQLISVLQRAKDKVTTMKSLVKVSSMKILVE